MNRGILVALLLFALGLGLWWCVFVVWADLPVPESLSQPPDSWSFPSPPEAEPDEGDEADLLAWDAFRESGEARLDLLARAAAARPEDPALRALQFQILFAHDRETGAATEERWRRAIEEAAAEGRRVDPENGLYEFGQAALILQAAFDGEALADRPGAERAIPLLESAASRGRFDFYFPKTSLHALARRVGVAGSSWVQDVGLWAATEMPVHLAVKDALARASTLAKAVHGDGDRERAHAIWKAALEISIAYQRQATTLSECFVGLAVEGKVRRDRIEAWVASGDAAAVDREWRIVQAVEEARSEARQLPPGVELSRFGVVDSLIVPIGGFRDLDPEIGRRYEYRAVAVAALGLVALALLVLASVQVPWIAAGRAPAEAPARAAELASAVALAVVLPVAAYLFLDRFHPSRGFGIAHQPVVLLQPLALTLVVLALVLRPRGSVGRVAAGSAAAGAFLAFFFAGPGLDLDPTGPTWWTVAFLATALALGLVAMVLGRPERPGRLARVAGLGFAAVLVLAAALVIPLEHHAESAYAERVIRPFLEDELAASQWARVRDLDREAAAKRER